MSKIFVNIGLSLDGYMAPEGMSLENWNKPEYKNWASKWGSLMGWLLSQKYFRETHNFGEGGETGPVNDMVKQTVERIGVSIMGKRMFEGGEPSWQKEAPFHTPVYVLTHERRAPLVIPDGTTFYFINDGIEVALEEAKKNAGGRDIRIAGGANLIQQYLNLGVVEELVPILFGGGQRLFENVADTIPAFRVDRVLHTEAATHLRYVRK